MKVVSYSKKLLPLVFLLFSGIVSAQDTTDNGNIKTQRLIIVKPYSPTVSDAVKLKQMPAKEADSAVTKKKKIRYDIYSIPVASTFTPEKGKASGVKRVRQPDLYDNYAALGIGNYTNILAEFYSNIEISKRQSLTIGLEHHSSQGGISGVQLDDKYYDTQLHLGYAQEENQFLWGLRLGFQHQLYNWYGVPANFIAEQEYTNINPTHNYTGISLGGDLKMKQGIFDKVSLDYRHFGDDFSSSEDHMVIKPHFQFDVGKEKINAEVSADYLNGRFNDSDIEHINYSVLNLGFHPSLSITRSEFTLNLGAQVVYSSDMENSKSDVYFYPKIKAGYRVAGDYFTLYAGADGELTQNTYYDFTQNNPYLAPDLLIAPTNKQYHIYFGGKGKFTEELSYDLRGGYVSEEHKTLFVHRNISSGFLSDVKPYDHANSFGLTYDDVNTLSVYGELNYALNDDINISLNATYYNYSTDKAAEAWNLPEIEAALTADYMITKKWSVGADIFYVGERKDLFGMGDFAPPETVTLDGFVDANLRLGFQLNDQLGFFLRGNNLFNDNYDSWLNYPVQGIQGMIGASYQF